MNFLRAEAEKGIFELTSAFNYSSQRGNGFSRNEPEGKTDG